MSTNSIPSIITKQTVLDKRVTFLLFMKMYKYSLELQRQSDLQ